jgi:hypothetical protein
MRGKDHESAKVPCANDSKAYFSEINKAKPLMNVSCSSCKDTMHAKAGLCLECAYVLCSGCFATHSCEVPSSLPEQMLSSASPLVRAPLSTDMRKHAADEQEEPLIQEVPWIHKKEESLYLKVD